MLRILSALILISAVFADVSHVPKDYETTEYPPVPYNFKYKAGRYPGHVDRIRTESGDASGVIHGSYSYIDPKFKVRTVDYTADKNGFYPVLKNFEDVQAQPQDSEAVQKAKERHFQLYQRIANAHSTNLVSIPRESASVARARDKHLELFNKIAAEHQAIAFERESQRKTDEYVTLPNNYQQYSH